MAADATDSTLVDMGALRRLQPIDPMFGGGRGKPIDRHYIEAFLDSNRADVRGAVLEVAEDHYTRRFGGHHVRSSDVLHRDGSNDQATIVADLATAAGLPEGRFDCFICTQTLQYVFDLQAALANVRRLLRPGGVLLLSVPGISQISTHDRSQWGEHWRFTPQSVERLLQAEFDTVQVAGHGNVLASIGFLHGLACNDLTAEELDYNDDRYPLLVTARAARALRIAPPAACTGGTSAQKLSRTGRFCHPGPAFHSVLSAGVASARNSSQSSSVSS